MKSRIQQLKKSIMKMKPHELEREAVWHKLGKKAIDTFDIDDFGEWATIFSLSGKELATRVNVKDAVRDFKKKLAKEKINVKW